MTALQAGATQGRLTAAGPSSTETVALFPVMIEELKQGITAAEGTAACPLREAAVAAAAAAAAVVAVVGAGEAAEEVEAVAAAAGNLPGTTHPLSKGGRSHGAIH